MSVKNVVSLVIYDIQGKNAKYSGTSNCADIDEDGNVTIRAGTVGPVYITWILDDSTNAAFTDPYIKVKPRNKNQPDNEWVRWSSHGGKDTRTFTVRDLDDPGSGLEDYNLYLKGGLVLDPRVINRPY